jgi:hypothetical protein
LRERRSVCTVACVRRVWKNYNLTVVLCALFLASWVLQTWMGWRHFASEQTAHGEAPHWFGTGGYIWSWGEATFENWQSEFLQLMTFVVLTAFLIHRGSHESKDTDEQMQAQLDRIERKLDALSPTDPPRRRPHDEARPIQ